MTDQELLDAIGQGEAKDWEFKSAKGGLPGSLWETYSAMANTDGGTIILGVGRANGDYIAEGLDDPDRMKRSFWDTVNNRGKVSVNLVTDERVTLRPVANKVLLIISVPRADRRARPIYVGQNPLTGTYRRNYEGDYHCTPDEVARMLADRGEEPADSRILEGFGLNDLDPISLQQYRQRFSARSPDHPWLAEDTSGLLVKLGGWRQDRRTQAEGLTVAGMLMFGRDEAIRDPGVLPGFHLDYRERMSDDPEVRWTDRLTIDGTWVANLFQFYQRTIQRLTLDLKIPFRLEPSLFRKDDTIVHEAFREALVNALIHADYGGKGGIVVEKHRSRIEMSNPGSLLVSLDQLLRGGISECRNKSLQTMFLMIGGGEKAGSGIDKILQAWRWQKWRWPTIQETVQPDRVVVLLPMVSLLPEESLAKLRDLFGVEVDKLSSLETQALVTAETEGEVTNSRLQMMCDEHPADLTKVLQGLANRGFLRQKGQKRGASYVLSRSPQIADLSHPEPDSMRKEPSSMRMERDSMRKSEDGPAAKAGLAASSDPALLDLAAPARIKQRIRKQEMRTLIVRLCEGRYLTLGELSGLLQRDPTGLRNRLLTRMVRERTLAMRFPGEPNHPQQAYTTVGGGAETA